MLKGIPTQRHLSRLYEELGKLGARTVGKHAAWPYDTKSPEELIALAADCSRYDPRLFEALVEFLARAWSEFNPYHLRLGLASMSCPQTLAVIGEFVRQVTDDPEAVLFFDYVSDSLQPVPYQLYFHHLYTPGGVLAGREAEESLDEFKKWGFLSTARPVIAQVGKKTVGQYESATRKNILRRLLDHHRSVTLSNYMDALGHSISRQQAFLDLKSFPHIKKQGHGRGAQWMLAPDASSSAPAPPQPR